MLPELALPAMDALQQLGHTPVTLDMQAMAELYREMRYKRHGGYELFLFYAKDIAAKGNLDFALSFGLSGILEDPTKDEFHYLPEEFGLPGLIYLHSRGTDDALAKLLKAGAAGWRYTTACCSSAGYAAAVRAAGVERVLHLPLGYSPRVFYPQDDLPAQPAFPLELNAERLTAGFDVSFAGSCTPFRAAILETLAAAGLRLAVFGDKTWEQTSLAGSFRGAARRLEDLNTLFNASPINLDLPAGAEATDYVSPRVLEALGSGGFVLALEQPGLAAVAAPGKEMASSGPAELADSARYWLDHPQERQALAAAGHARVKQEAQWTHRLQEAMGRLEIGVLSSAR
jgi:hypothetical protein